MPRTVHIPLPFAFMAAWFLTWLIVGFFALSATAGVPGKFRVQQDAGPVPVPAAGDIYWGVWTDSHRTKTQPPWDMRPAEQIEAQAGKQMSLLQFSTPWANKAGTKYFEFPTNEFSKVWSHGSIPLFSWSSHAMRNYSDRDFSLKTIIDGKHDAYITRWATAAKAWGHPFLLRFNWEMNGDWFPWSEQWGKNKPGEYVAAWRHVRRIFTRVGATNAAWVWCPAVDPYDDLQSIESLYPGKSQVDWTCLDAYNTYTQWKSFANLTAPMYKQITQSIAPGKPMLIGETASTETGGNKPAWIDAMFATIHRDYPSVRGLAYYDKDTPGPGGRRRLPLDSSPATTAAFARGVQQPWVLGSNWQSLRTARKP